MAISISASPGRIAPSTVTNVTITGSGGTTWQSGTTGTFSVSGVAGTTLTSTTILNDTTAVLGITTGSTTGSLTITDTTSGDSSPTTTITVNVVLSVFPSHVPMGASTTVTLVGTGAAWTSGGSPTFTISGVTGTTIGTVTFESATTVTAVVTTDSTHSGTATITDTLLGDGSPTVSLSVGGAMVDAAVSSGAIWGYGIEGSTQGVPAAITHVFDAEYSGNTFEYDPGLKDVTLLTGTPNNTVAYVRTNGTVNITIAMPLSPAVVLDLFPNIGFTNNGGSGIAPAASNLRQPKSLTIMTVIQDPSGSSFDCQQFAGCRASRVTINAGYDKIAECIVEFEGIVAPITGTPPTLYPVYDDPYTWTDWVFPTLIGGSTLVDCQDFTMVFDWKLANFYGGGKNLPTRNSKTANMVTGSITPLHVPTEYDAASANTRGLMLFSFIKQGTSHFLSLTAPNCVYTKFPINMAQDQYITDSMQYAAIDRVLGSGSTVVNQPGDPVVVQWN